MLGREAIPRLVDQVWYYCCVEEGAGKAAAVDLFSTVLAAITRPQQTDDDAADADAKPARQNRTTGGLGTRSQKKPRQALDVQFTANDLNLFQKALKLERWFGEV